MPPYIPAHGLMVFLSGLAEVILGVALLFPATRTYAAWGIILLFDSRFTSQYFYDYFWKIYKNSRMDFMAKNSFAVFVDLVGLWLYKGFLNHPPRK